MRENKQQQIRRKIELKIADILRDDYHQSVDPGMPIRYYLDFKSDEHLLALRSALDRVERSDFGHCALCGMDISPAVLDVSPEVQFCAACNHPHLPGRHSQAGMGADPESHAPDNHTSLRA